MRILVVGATGLIGAAVVAKLHEAGHEVVPVVRSVPAAARLPVGDPIVIDLAEATTPEAWRGALRGVDAIVYAAGTLQDGPGESTRGVHETGAAALFRAAAASGVRRVVHLSAIGVDRGTPTAFSETKLAGDRALTALDLDWVVLRPSVVVGRQAFGGSALFRGLAALPILPEIGGGGPLQIVQLDDLVATILFFLRPEAPSRVALEIAGPERLSMTEVVQAYRRWLGWGRARVVRMPRIAAGLLYRLGDLVGRLGWRPPIRSTAEVEIRRGAVGDPEPGTRLTGIAPQSLGAALAATPSSVQERWFARLYFLKPLMLGVFSLFWIGTGIISLGPGWEIGVAYMREGGAGALSGPSVIGGALADIAIGIGIAVRRTTRLALTAAIAITVFYILAGTAILPRLWADPLGPMWKIWPILAFNVACLAILEDR